MLPTAALIAGFVGLCLSQHVTLVPLNVNSWQRLPFPVQVGTRFVIRGIYRSSSYKNAAKISLFDGGNNLPLTMHLKFNQDNDAGTGATDHFIVTSRHDETYAGTKAKKYAFPMTLEDNLKISVLVEVKASHYEVTINGVTSSRSMINNREDAEYFRIVALKLESSASFTFKFAAQGTRIGKLFSYFVIWNTYCTYHLGRETKM